MQSLADLLGPETARRLYGPIAAGGTVGTLVGPALTTALVEYVASVPAKEDRPSKREAQKLLDQRETSL